MTLLLRREPQEIHTRGRRSPSLTSRNNQCEKRVSYNTEKRKLQRDIKRAVRFGESRKLKKKRRETKTNEKLGKL